jgi:hypothetical protein
MPRRARPSRLLAPLAVLLAVPLGACGRSDPDACPGQPIGTFSFAGVRDLAAAPGGAPACPPETGYGDAPIAFRGTLSSDAQTLGAAFCSGRALAANLFGQRSGDAVLVEASTTGAVLGGCGASCATDLTVVLRGTVTRDAAGAASGFDGEYVERMERIAGDCGACPLPCDARYDVTGTRVR